MFKQIICTDSNLKKIGTKIVGF